MSQQQRIPMYVSFASIIKHPEFGRRPSTKIEEQFWYIIHKNKEFLCVIDEFNATIGSNSMSVVEYRAINHQTSWIWSTTIDQNRP